MMNRLRKEGRRHSSAVDWSEPKATYHLALRSDAVELLKALPTGSVQLAILDPPYNLDIATWDSYGDYIGWAKGWLAELPRILCDRGSAVIFGGLQYRSERTGDLLELMHFVRHHSPLRLVNLVVWNYSTGMGAHRFFANRHEEMAWYARSDKYYFDLDSVRQKFDRKTLARYSRDRRLNPESLLKGKNPGNVWRIERLNANSSERVGHPTQKPSELVRRLIRALSYPGSLVLDPFAGSGVTARVCIEEGRNSVCSDSGPKFAGYLKKQLKLVREPRCPFVFLKDRAVSDFFKSV
jgi:site-specific DNA-methyltransferase (adenine-specific)